MFLSFQSALKGLTALQEVGYETQTDTYIGGKLFMRLILFRQSTHCVANSTEPKRIVCLLKYDWQHFLRPLLHHLRSREAGPPKRAVTRPSENLPRKHRIGPDGIQQVPLLRGRMTTKKPNAEQKQISFAAL